MAKPVARHVLNARAANKILNILGVETPANRRIIVGFVTDSLGDLPDADPDPRQMLFPLPNGVALDA